MNLTQQEKEQYFKQSELLIWKTVHEFKRRCSSILCDDEDLYQECVTALMEYANTAETPADLRYIPVKDMIHAMCVFILNNQPVSYPKRTTDFGALMKKLHLESRRIQHLGAGESTPQFASSFEDEVIDEVDFDRFFSSLSSNQQQVVSLKRQRYTNAEIGRELGVGRSTVCQTVGRVRSSFRNYFIEE